MEFFKRTIFIFSIIPFILSANNEPSLGYVITKGEKDPVVPPSSEMNGDNPVLQLRTKHLSGANILKKIQFKSLSGTVRFGNGIKSATLYLDENEDGKTEGDPSSETIVFWSDKSTFSFENLNIEYSSGETKYLLLNLNLDLKDGDKFQIEIPIAGVELSDNITPIAGTPIRSKEYTYICNEDPNCGNSEISDSDSIDEKKENNDNDICETCDRSVDVNGCSLTVL